MIEYREQEHEELVEKLHKAKKAICEAWEALEQTGTYNERGRYRMSERMGHRDSMEETPRRNISRYEY